MGFIWKNLDKIRNIVTPVDNNKISDEITKSLDKLSSAYEVNNNYVTLLQYLYSDVLGSDMENGNMSQDPNTNFFPSQDKGRINRYVNAVEIVDSISYADAALKVLSAEILSPDHITKEILEIRSGSTGNTDVENDVKNIIKSTELENHLDEVISDTLKLGDQFIEFCDYKANDVPLSQTMLQETEKTIVQLEFVDGEVTKTQDVELDLILYDHDILKHKTTKNRNFEILTENFLINNKSSNQKSHALDDLRLIIHDPSQVVKIQSRRFKSCLGYLIIPSSSVGQLSPSQNVSVGSYFGGSAGSGGSGGDDGIDQLYLGMMNKIKKSLNSGQIDIDKGELKNLLIKSLGEFDKEQAQQIQARYVPTYRMTHFRTQSKRFFPYGESFFYKGTFNAKMLIAMTTAVAVKRIGDSTDRRAIYVETGTPRNVRDMIENIKEARTKRKVSIDKFGSISAIPSMITSYQDFYIPQTKGKRYVEFETIPPTQNARDATDELKMFRDSFIASFGIPPSFLGVEENLCCCLNTKIELVNNTQLTLKQIIQDFEDGIVHELYNYNKQLGMIGSAKIKWAGVTRKQTKLIRIHLDNKEYLDCTYDHPVMLRDGSYIRADQLTPNNSLMTLYTRERKHISFVKKAIKITTHVTELICKCCRNKKDIPKMDSKVHSSLDHKVIKIEYLEGLHDTGDITVEGDNHNFALSAGVFVHNSNKNALSHENILFARSIVNYQTNFSVFVRELVAKIYYYTQKTILPKDITVVFKPPKLLESEHMSEHFRTLADIIETLSNLGINKEFLKKKYLPMDWVAIEEFENETKIDDKLNAKPDEEPNGMGGIVGGGMDVMGPL